jgi:hypothetical protein
VSVASVEPAVAEHGQQQRDEEMFQRPVLLHVNVNAMNAATFHEAGLGVNGGAA